MNRPPRGGGGSAYSGVRPIALALVRADDDLQPRHEMQEDAVGEYAGRMGQTNARGFAVDGDGQEWPALVVYKDLEGTHWLADGFHRFAAARRAGLEEFQARIVLGSKRDAVAFSLSANEKNGIRRTNDDKRKAVTRALLDPEWRKLSDRGIAKMCLVSNTFVGNVRAELELEDAIPEVTERVATDGRAVDAERHGGGDHKYKRDGLPSADRVQGVKVRGKDRPDADPEVVAAMLELALEHPGANIDATAATVSTLTLQDVEELRRELEEGKKSEAPGGRIPSAPNSVTKTENESWSQFSAQDFRRQVLASDLSSTARLVLLVLAEFADEAGVIDIKHDQIGAYASLTPASVSRTTSELEGVWFARDRGAYGYIYTLTQPTAEEI